MKHIWFGLVAGLVFNLVARAAVVSIPASQDAAIYEDAGGTLANGAGNYLFAGKTSQPLIRRSLIRFDVAANVPSGAVITQAVLRITCDQRAGSLSIHRVTSDWNEGPTAASGAEGGGASSAAGDVTWLHRNYNSLFWSSPGGDFNPTALASSSVASVPDVMNFSSAALVADVQSALDSPAANYGWMFVNDNEGSASSAMRMYSRSHPTTGSRPVLEIGYSTAPQPVLYYDFEEGGGTVITNKAPGGTNGILSGTAAAWVAGPTNSFTPSQALLFDGVHPVSTGVVVDTTYTGSGLAMGDSAYTVATWLNFTKNTGDSMVVGQLFTPNYLHLGIRNRNVYFGHYAFDLASTRLLDTGVWYHVAWVFEGGRTAGVQRIFINGVADRVQGERVMLRIPESNVVVGAVNASGSGGHKGALDEVAIYSTALSESQIAYLANGGSPLTVPDASLADRDFFTAPYGTNGTWNLYERIGGRHGAVTSWYGAYVAATARVAMVAGVTATPHLVAIQSSPENEFIRRLLRWDQTNYVQTVIESSWIGLADDTSGVVQVSNEETTSTNALAARRAGFTNWIDGTPVIFSNWGANEPNDSAPGEDAIELQSAGTWNDQRSGVPGTEQVTNSIDNMFIIEWDVNAPTPITSPSATVRRVQAMIPAQLPGPTGTNDSFGGYWHRAPAALAEIRNGVEHLLRSTTPGYGTTLTTNSGLPFINAYDPEVPGNANSVLFPANVPYFANVGGATDVNFCVVYKGVIRIRAADAGVWTFGVHTDDGFALRLPGHEWIAINGLGVRDPGDFEVMGFEYGTGDSNTRGTVNLGIGDHHIEFVVFNAGGGQHHELYAAKGSFTNDADTGAWLPVGFFATNGLATPGLYDPGSGTGWTVWHSVPNTFGGIGNTNAAWLAVQPSILGDSNKTFWSAINFYDLGSGQLPNAGSIPNSARFPYDIEQTNNTEINVAMFMTGQLIVPRSGTYFLGFQGDDGSWLRVDGKPWSHIAYTALSNANTYIEGDKLVCNQGGGNTRTIGVIELPAGVHVIESLWWQGGGGAHYEILCAHADNPLALPNTTLPLLATGTAEANAIGGGLQLVSTNAPGDISLVGFSATETGPHRISWNAERGTTYSILVATNIIAPDWTTNTTGITTDVPPIVVTIPATNPAPVLFHRIERTLP